MRLVCNICRKSCSLGLERSTGFGPNKLGPKFLGSFWWQLIPVSLHLKSKIIGCKMSLYWIDSTLVNYKWIQMLQQYQNVLLFPRHDFWCYNLPIWPYGRCVHCMELSLVSRWIKGKACQKIRIYRLIGKWVAIKTFT